MARLTRAAPWVLLAGVGAVAAGAVATGEFVAGVVAVGVVAGADGAVAAGVVTVRYGRPMWGSVPLILAGVIAIVWGPSGHSPSSLLVIAWWVGLIVWWAWASAIGRARLGADIVIGMASTATTASTTMGGSSRQIVHVWWRVGMGALMVGVMVAAAIPAASLLGPTASDRVVGRDVVEPPVE